MLGGPIDFIGTRHMSGLNGVDLDIPSYGFIFLISHARRLDGGRLHLRKLKSGPK